MAWYWWAAFVAGICGLLLIDLIAFRKEGKLSSRRAAIYSGVWITLGVAFSGVIYAFIGSKEAQDYLTGYVLEKTLSVDNLFVFVIIFNYFKVPAEYQHRALFYGIFGALIFRALFIGLGVALLQNFSWIAFLFGLFLLYTAYQLANHQELDVEPEHNRALQFFRRFMPMTKKFHGERFFVREDGVLKATPLLTVLIILETTDIFFAVDSIPAIFAVTRDPFIVFSSNAFAILGLRALYFLLADLMDRFEYLDTGLALVLGIVGLKMIYEEFVHLQTVGTISWFPESLIFHIPSWMSLVLVSVILGTAMLFSWKKTEGKKKQNPEGNDAA